MQSANENLQANTKTRLPRNLIVDPIFLWKAQPASSAWHWHGWLGDFASGDVKVHIRLNVTQPISSNGQVHWAFNNIATGQPTCKPLLKELYGQQKKFLSSHQVSNTTPVVDYSLKQMADNNQKPQVSSKLCLKLQPSERFSPSSVTWNRVNSKRKALVAYYLLCIVEHPKLQFYIHAL